jgi:hypothetical protein
MSFAPNRTQQHVTYGHADAAPLILTRIFYQQTKHYMCLKHWHPIKHSGAQLHVALVPTFLIQVSLLVEELYLVVLLLYRS